MTRERKVAVCREAVARVVVIVALLMLLGGCPDDSIFGTLANDANGEHAGTNAELSGLMVSEGNLTPAFDSGITAYEVQVLGAVQSITVTATSADANATVAYDPAQPVDLAIGENPVTITVTAEDGTTTKEYVVLVVRDAVGSAGPAGGIVFYDKGDDSDGWRYLEAWTEDEEVTEVWKTVDSWTGGTSKAIGAGHSNTYIALAALEHSAAERARMYHVGAFDDWFLPSKDELQLMFEHRDVIGGFVSSYYWSSSEHDDKLAWAQHFGHGSQISDEKSQGLWYIRPVRAF